MGSFTLTPQVPYSIPPKTLICPHSLGPRDPFCASPARRAEGRGGEGRRQLPKAPPPPALPRPEMPRVENHSESSLCCPQSGNKLLLQAASVQGAGGGSRAGDPQVPTGASGAPPGPSRPPLSILSTNAPHPTTVTPLPSAPLEEEAHLGFSCGAGDWEESTFACSDPEAIPQTNPQDPPQEGSSECSGELDVSRTP